MAKRLREQDIAHMLENFDDNDDENDIDDLHGGGDGWQVDEIDEGEIEIDHDGSDFEVVGNEDVVDHGRQELGAADTSRSRSVHSRLV